MKNKMLCAAAIFVATTSVVKAQEIKTTDLKEIPTEHTSLESLIDEKKLVEESLKLEEIKLQNEKDTAKRLEQERKIAKEQQKEELRAQKQLEKEHKAELKKQKEIIKSQKRVSKQTLKLQKAEDKYNARNSKYVQKKASGKLTPIEDLKFKKKLLDLQTNIKTHELELKKLTMEFEAINK
ncbi:hypothetical protein [Myroides sp. C4067]|uniref:hypothetical protein n=1 Tax=Myroides sp. C4067 TaxID=3136765 RepID=UPI003100C962